MTASILNGPETIPVPEVRYDSASGKLVLGFPHYDSAITANWSGKPDAFMDGSWSKRTAGSNEWIVMKFSAIPSQPDSKLASPPNESAPDVSGRWGVNFAGDEDRSVGLFESRNGLVTGTFLTTTGDYRFLAGSMRDNVLTLSCFDGAHAFLFRGVLDKDEKLAGDFWSSTNWHDKWTAERDENAALPDPLGLTRWNEKISLADLKFPDVDGVVHSLDEDQFAGRAIVLQLFGTWCPNCDDAGNLLAELHRQYSPNGLSVVGLAFELTDDPVRNARQVRRYMDRHQSGFPVLIAGLSDKARATESFRGLDRIRSFPSTIFMSGRGDVRAIYTGFSGPATGAEHEKLKAAYHRLITGILDETK